MFFDKNFEIMCNYNCLTSDNMKEKQVMNIFYKFTIQFKVYDCITI